MAVAVDREVAAQVVEQPGAPPWMWFVTAFFKANPLSQGLMAGLVFYYSFRAMHAGFAALQPHFFGRAEILFSVFISSLLAALPYIAVGLGSLGMFFPVKRAKYVEAKYGLADLPELPVMDEIAEFVQQHAPQLELRANLLRAGMLCFVYPCGRNRARLAIFGGLVRLWSSDRARAEAVLLHEIAHYRRGDAYHLGAGSAFELGLRVGVAALAVYIVPWLLGLLRASLFHSYRPEWFVAERVLHLLNYLLTGLSVVWPVLAATWVAEYGADYQAATQVGAENVIAALEAASEEGTALRRFFNRLTHPSLQNRRCMLELPPQKALLRMTLIFPLTLLYVTCINLLSIMFAALAFDRALHQMAQAGQPLLLMPTKEEALRSGLRIFVLFLLLALTLFFWPLWHAKFTSFWTARPRTDRTYALVYVKAGGLVLLMMFGVMMLWGVITDGVFDWWRQFS